MTVQVTVDERADDQPEPERRTAPQAREVPASVRRRLAPMPSDGWRSWAVAAWVVAIAALLRFVKVGFPPTILFDEVYYANDGQDLLTYGVEWTHETDDAGNTTADHVEFVVHPPLGKWLIAAGIWFSRTVLGQGPAVGLADPNNHGITSDAFGWRLAPVVFGVLSVLIVTRMARRLFRSTVLGATAGLLVALDGMHFVLSRTAILDIFVMFFIVAAFACLLIDRDQRRARWLREMDNGLDPSQPGPAGRPRLTWGGVPWWRIAAGVLLGLGCGVKWSVVFFIPVFAVLVLLWEVGLRKTVGARRPWRDAVLDEVGWIVAMVAIVVPAYLATWWSWFATDDGWKRHWLASQGRSEGFLIGPLYNLWSYHTDMFESARSISSAHPYQSWPWQWLLLGRPVAFYWDGEAVNCGEADCAAEILLLGTPLLWWSFIPALIAMTWFGISRRDWRPLAIGAGAAAGILPWCYFWLADNRTMYYFYALASQPFLVLAVTYVLGCLINGPGVGRYGSGRVRLGLALSVEDRRLYGTVVAGAFVVLVAICFWIYYPIYVGDSIPHDEWWKRMLLGNRWV